MVHQNELDIAFINEWVLVHDPRQTMKMDAERLGVAVDYFVGFFYVDATAGMSLNIETYCTVAADNITSTKGPRDLNTRTVMRVTTFKDFTVSILTETQQKALNLPDEPDWLQYYKVENQAEIDRMRQIKLLHPLRAPGFPDDIQFVLAPTKAGMQPEGVWGKLIANPQESLYVVRLLNQPNQDFDGIRLNDLLLVQIKEIPQGISSICVGRAKPN
jgi:hypothetical protein